MTLFAYIPIAEDWQLLDHRLQHVRAAGVDRILLDLNIPEAADPSVVEQLEARILPYDAEIANIHRGPYRGLKNRREQTLARYCHDEDWVLLGDMDEFPWLDHSVHALIELCDDHGFDFVTGVLIDRVSEDGTLPTVDESLVHEQFPVAADITGAINGALALKVPLLRPWIRLTEGQHHALNGTCCPANLARISIDHFKWSEGVGRRSAAMRREDIGLGQAGHAWRRQELARQQAFLGKPEFIDLADNRLDAYVPDRHHQPVFEEIRVRSGLAARPRRNTESLYRRPRLIQANNAADHRSDWLAAEMTGNLTIQQLALTLSERQNYSYHNAVEAIESVVEDLEQRGVVDYPEWRLRADFDR